MPTGGGGGGPGGQVLPGFNLGGLSRPGGTGADLSGYDGPGGNTMRAAGPSGFVPPSPMVAGTMATAGQLGPPGHSQYFYDRRQAYADRAAASGGPAPAFMSKPGAGQRSAFLGSILNKGQPSSPGNPAHLKQIGNGLAKRLGSFF